MLSLKQFEYYATLLHKTEVKNSKNARVILSFVS